MTTPTLEPPELVVQDTAAWRRWLGAHHAQPDGVWLVLAKKGTTKPTSLTYDQALEEALCYLMDRRPSRPPRRGNLPATIHTSPPAEPLVEAEYRTGRASARGRADASGGGR